MVPTFRALDKLIVPVTLTDAQYTEEWQNVSWQGRSFSDEAPGFTTVRGERVRSKSEIIIADTLNITMESQHSPLNTRQLEQIIKTYLC